jgi:two-component system, NtrC family, response regulator GlrR
VTPSDPDPETSADRTDDNLGGRTLDSASSAPATGAVRSFRLTVVEGPQPGVCWESAADRCSIGSHTLNDLVIEDPTVSRFHCELLIDAAGARVCDLNSRNGTIVDGVLVRDAFLRSASLLRLGRAVVRFDFGAESNKLRLSDKAQFGTLVGTSVAMRATFALLERAAATDATVLLEGETGTGKGAAAESIHRLSARRDRSFIVVDCGAIPANLLESELFGHEKGAFTSADARRIGAFEEAHGGTIFLDEIGELPQDLQPKLLRALESREVRRVGSNIHKSVNVRMIAATNRDLRAEVNAGRFRPDLYFRLAVVKIPLPPLRQRPEDIPGLVTQVLSALGADRATSAQLGTPEFLNALQRAAWPGNVRELRNYLERCLVFQDAVPMGDHGPASGGFGVGIDPSLPYADARRIALAEFERRYLEGLLRLHQGRVAQAAGAAGIDRVYLYRLLRRHGIKP